MNRDPAPALELSESDEAATMFFAPAPDARATREELVELAPEEQAPAAPARPPVDPARRRALRRYVATALAVASVICVAAIVRGAVARTDREPPPARAASVPSTGPPVEAPRPAAPPPAPEAPPPEPVVEPFVTASPTAPVAAPVASVPPEPDPLAAREAKKIAQRALDRGKVAEAIEAGERSVALDPTDGDAWLVLGAAYQLRGATAEARRCFSSCVRQGTRGPRGECAALLR
jgi:tetratricopeptide (TPR) repeat protein